MGFHPISRVQRVIEGSGLETVRSDHGLLQCEVCGEVHAVDLPRLFLDGGRSWMIWHSAGKPYAYCSKCVVAGVGAASAAWVVDKPEKPVWWSVSPADKALMEIEEMLYGVEGAVEGLREKLREARKECYAEQKRAYCAARERAAADDDAPEAL